jgi:hypothetical protein
MIQRLCLLIFFTALSVLCAFAQNDSVYYFKYNGTRVNNWDSAGYYRKLGAHGTDGIRFTDHYKDGTTTKGLFTGGVESPRYIGTITWNYKDGSLYLTQQYVNGRLARTSRYHPNGILLDVTDQNAPGSWPVKLLMYEADSTGKINIINGKGIHKIVNATYAATGFNETYTMEGPYVAGIKQGEWKGKTSIGYTFTDTYERDKFTKGVSTTPDGKTYRYEHLYVLPDFKHRRAIIENFIINHLENPLDTLTLLHFNKNSFALNYTVNSQGEVTDIYGYKNDTRINLRLTKPCPIIKPGYVRGIPANFEVKCYFIFGYEHDLELNRPFNTDVYIKGQYTPKSNN